ncbi:MAG TPA: hypothetical protein VGN88_09225 [Phycisphaerae bacterium]|jgi:hypothetical protein
MSEAVIENKPDANAGGKWPAGSEPAVTAPVTQAALANAAARAAASGSRRDLLDYLRLRRKGG